LGSCVPQSIVTLLISSRLVMPALHLRQARASQIPHTGLLGRVVDVDGVAASHDDAADVLGHRHHLVDAQSALVAVGAGLAAARPEELHALAISSSGKPSLRSASAGTSMGWLAGLAEAARQALRDDQAHRGGDGVGLHAHVDQARQRLRRVVGVQRGEHQVAGLRGLDGDLRRLEVADFADHDHVRILAQEGAQRGSKREADLVVHVHLVDAGQVDFSRVFRGRDVACLRCSGC
jgi:hypothetical protein